MGLNGCVTFYKLTVITARLPLISLKFMKCAGCAPSFSSCSIHFNPPSIQFQRIELIERLNWMNHSVLCASLPFHWSEGPCFVASSFRQSYFMPSCHHSLHIVSFIHFIKLNLIAWIELKQSEWRQNYRRYFNPAPHPLCPSHNA